MCSRLQPLLAWLSTRGQWDPWNYPSIPLDGLIQLSHLDLSNYPTWNYPSIPIGQCSRAAGSNLSRSEGRMSSWRLLFLSWWVWNTKYCFCCISQQGCWIESLSNLGPDGLWEMFERNDDMYESLLIGATSHLVERRMSLQFSSSSNPAWIMLYYFVHLFNVWSDSIHAVLAL